MASRLVDTLITYRIIKLLVTPFENQEAFKQGIIDKDGKVLKRKLKRVGLGSKLGSFAVALALLLKENKEYEQHKTLIESAVVTYLKETNQYEQLLNEQGEVKPVYETEPLMTCFGIDVYEKEGQLYSEDEYEKF